MMKTIVPAPMVGSLPKQSAIWPAKGEGKAPVNMIKDTVKPRITGDSSPNDSRKAGMTVIAPMLPVSSLIASIRIS